MIKSSLIRYQDIARLHDGDYFLDGKLYDAKGNEVPLVVAETHHRTGRTDGKAVATHAV